EGPGVTMVEWLLPFGLPEWQWRHFISRIGDRSTVQSGQHEAGQYGCRYNRPSGEIADHVNLKERFQELTLFRKKETWRIIVCTGTATLSVSQLHRSS